MTPTRNALALTACLLLASTPLAARDLTEAEETGLEARIESFEAALVEGDPAALTGVIPPGVVTVMSEQTGLAEEALKEAMEQAIANTMAAVTIEAYSFDLPAATIGETSAGRTYALIPTSVELRKGEQPTVTANRETLAFEDAGAWYLVRLDSDDEMDLLYQAYPEFEGIGLSSDDSTANGD